MARLAALVARVLRCPKGTAAIEYAVLIGLIACALTLALIGLGGNVNGTMAAVQNELPTNKTIDVSTQP